MLGGSGGCVQSSCIQVMALGRNQASAKINALVEVPIMAAKSRSTGFSIPANVGTGRQNSGCDFSRSTRTGSFAIRLRLAPGAAPPARYSAWSIEPGTNSETPFTGATVVDSKDVDISY
jgi:hypothetical protein